MKHTKKSRVQNSKDLLVSIIIGSENDKPIIEMAEKALENFGIGYETKVISAHRLPHILSKYLSTISEKGIEVIIAGAGMAAHLPGVIASQVTIPVIGVPLKSSALNGVDALYSIVQMPPGVPVATVAIDGAKNAAYLTAQILGLKYKKIEESYRKIKEEERKKLSGKVVL